MKVIFHEDFYKVYTGDPASAPGRMESIVKTIEPHVEFVQAEPAVRQQIAAIHAAIARKPKGRHGAHRYDFSNTGWDPGVERERFRAYQRRYAVPSEG